MTKGKGDRGGGNSGGRKPPKEHQWPKGKSGNPKGRPKKAAAEPFDGDVAEIILAEGFKTITLIEGGKPVSMLAIQAAIRAMLLSAMKGNSHAGRSYVQHVANAQARQQKQKQDAVEAALAIKIQLEAERAQWLAQGHDEIDMPLHPSDVEIDGVTGEVKHFLAFTDEQRKARSKMIELRDYLIKVIERSQAAAAEDGDDAFLEINRVAALTSIVDINQKLPARFRRVPPGDEPPVNPESSPEEMWQAMMKPIFDLLLSRLRSNDGASGGSDSPSSGRACDASDAGPSGDMTEGADRRASSPDEEGEQS